MTMTKRSNPKPVAIDAWHWLASDGRLAYPPRDLVVAEYYRQIRAEKAGLLARMRGEA